MKLSSKVLTRLVRLLFYQCRWFNLWHLVAPCSQSNPLSPMKWILEYQCGRGITDFSHSLPTAFSPIFSLSLLQASTLHAIITSFLVAFELDPYNAYAFTTPPLRNENVVAAVCSSPRFKRNAPFWSSPFSRFDARRIELSNSLPRIVDDYFSPLIPDPT